MLEGICTQLTFHSSKWRLAKCLALLVREGLYKKKKKKNNNSRVEAYLVSWSSLAFHELWYHYTHGHLCRCTNRIQMKGDIVLVHIYRPLYIQERRVGALQYHASLRRTDVHGDSEVTCLVKKA